ncbi:MAG: acyl-CoA dehydrogenase family protein, partial [Thermoplasmata archaeon]|nr:acyl-CoA dehydrogenase family protein [Thermoplasmata archaeon]
GLGLPARWGGVGGNAVDTVGVLEELSSESAAVATLLAVHLSVAAMPILQWGSDAQRETYLRPLAEGQWLGAFALTEPGAGSDTARLATRYERRGDSFRLNGAKMFITNAASADLLLTFATRDPALGHRGISAFLLRTGTQGYAVSQHLDKLGIRGSETSGLTFDDVDLGHDALLGPEGKGLSVALSALVGGRVGIAACALGVARSAMEEMREAARRNPSDERRAMVARAYVDVAAASALVTEAARQKDAGQPFEEAASAAKLFASQAAVRIASDGIDVGGVEATRRGSRAERLLRDARVFPIVEGTTDIQEMILGRALLGQSGTTARPSP